MGIKYNGVVLIYGISQKGRESIRDCVYDNIFLHVARKKCEAEIHLYQYSLKACTLNPYILAFTNSSTRASMLVQKMTSIVIVIVEVFDNTSPIVHSDVLSTKNAENKKTLPANASAIVDMGITLMNFMCSKTS